MFDIFQRGAGVGVEDFRVRVGVAQLQILRHEFHIHQAAAIVFDRPRHVGMALGVHAQAHVGDIDHQLARVALGAQHVLDDGCDGGFKRLRPGDGARAGQRHVFPGPGIALLIGFERGQGGGDGSGVARGAQAHVDFVQRPFRRGRAERIDETLAQARKILADRQGLFTVGCFHSFVAGIDEGQVHVRGGGFFTPAQLAERHHAQAPAGHTAMVDGEIVFDARL